jgi:hypothetical protein
MKKVLLVCLLSILSACATPNPLEEANIQTGVIYKFINPTLSTSLYVKLLPPNGDKNELLFKTARNNELVNSLELGGPGVKHQKAYHVSSRGKIRFRFFEEGLYETLLRDHQYSGYGSQQDNVTIFRYRLDFRKAIKLQ